MFDDDFGMDDAFDTDWEYEHFRETTGHIANFDAKDVQLYERAIEEYKKVDPSAVMWVDDGYKWAGLKGFYVTHYESDGAGLSPFWRIFDKIKAGEQS